MRTYYAGATRITDRSLEILGRMPSLERLEFYQCLGLTNAGLAPLARLPRLRENRGRRIAQRHARRDGRVSTGDSHTLLVLRSSS